MHAIKCKMKRYLKNDAGVSLIEILIAVAIFAIGISAVAVLQYKTVGGNLRGRMITDATTLAEREMERLMELPYATLASGSDNTTAPYTVTWTVTPVDLDVDGTNETRQVDIKVTAPQLPESENKHISIVFYKDNLK